jgi:hypothetical protein
MIEDRKHQKAYNARSREPYRDGSNRRKKCKPRKLHHQERRSTAEQIEENEIDRKQDGSTLREPSSETRRRRTVGGRNFLLSNNVPRSKLDRVDSASRIVRSRHVFSSTMKAPTPTSSSKQCKGIWCHDPI